MTQMLLLQILATESVPQHCGADAGGYSPLANTSVTAAAAAITAIVTNAAAADPWSVPQHCGADAGGWRLC
jgi:hypothetical protein